MKSIQHNQQQINHSLQCDGLGSFERRPVKPSASGVAFGCRPTHAGLLPVQESTVMETGVAPLRDEREPADRVSRLSTLPDYLSEPEQTLFSTVHHHRMSGAQRPLPANGLSIGHITPQAVTPPTKDPQTATMSVALGGSLVRIKGRPINAEPDQRPRTPRGEVREFSSKSKQRMTRSIAEIDKEACGTPLFVTLTYPGVYPADRCEWKRHLDALDKRMRREFEDFQFFVWKLEPQKRGAPHFHFLLSLSSSCVDDDRLNRIRRFIAYAWYEIVGSGRSEHLQAGTQVQLVKSWAGAMHYTSKYLAKTFDGSEIPGWWQPGRFWGKRGSIPTDIHEVRLTLKQFYAVRRLAFRQLRSFTRGSGHRPKIWSPDSGVAIQWSENTFLKVLAYACTIVYDPPNGTNERSPNQDNDDPGDTG